MTSEVEAIARVAHSVNKAYCESIGDHTQPQWKEAPEWQKESAIEGVKFHLEGTHTPEESHESWMKQKREDGWVWGLVKDPSKKEHPCMVPYEDLPQKQKTKDFLFTAVVESMAPSLAETKEISFDTYMAEHEAEYEEMLAIKHSFMDDEEDEL